MTDVGTIREQPSTPERPSGPLLEERSLQLSTTNFSVLNTISPSDQQPSTPERPSGPSLEQKFRDPILNGASSSTTNVDMADSEVANMTTHQEFESLEDLTVYEVVTEYQSVPPISTTNYPHIFLQLRDGQIINVENGEIVIQFFSVRREQ